MKASDHLRSVLSGVAIGALERLDLRRDEALVRPAEELRRRLADRGWPVYESAVTFDDAVGGITLGRKTPLGVFAALDRRSRAPAPRDDELLRLGERTLLPADGGLITEFWLDGDGVVYRGTWADGSGDPDDEDYCAPVYASYRSMLERFALQQEPWWPQEPDLIDWHRRYTVHANSLLGSEVAAALGVASWSPASDPFARVWRGDPTLVIERAPGPGIAMQTSAWLATLDQVLDAWRVIAALSPGARVAWHGPPPAPPEVGDTPTLRLSLQTAAGLRELTVHGVPCRYRVSGW